MLYGVIVARFWLRLRGVSHSLRSCVAEKTKVLGSRMEGIVSLFALASALIGGSFFFLRIYM